MLKFNLQQYTTLKNAKFRPRTGLCGFAEPCSHTVLDFNSLRPPDLSIYPSGPPKHNQASHLTRLGKRTTQTQPGPRTTSEPPKHNPASEPPKHNQTSTQTQLGKRTAQTQPGPISCPCPKAVLDLIDLLINFEITQNKTSPNK